MDMPMFALMVLRPSRGICILEDPAARIGIPMTQTRLLSMSLFRFRLTQMSRLLEGGMTPKSVTGFTSTLMEMGNFRHTPIIGDGGFREGFSQAAFRML